MLLPLFLLVQQAVPGSTPPSGDTTGYWQQQVSYTIVATLDEAADRLRARGELVYVNNSPDTLREMYFHQYLNAFRPQSKWSEVDDREGRVRFQRLGEPDYGYEDFTERPTFDGVPVTPMYPGAPDSTVVRFVLPKPLAPGGSIHVTFAWNARPSTVPRRQGRRGRTWDFAQWYPKVAVYDRGGWEPNALQPAGELYGEYGTYDVTVVVKDDQVVAATGVPVSGDPGWARVQHGGLLRLGSDAYGELPPAPAANVPEGYRAVRFVARDIHHFAWTASPDYRYEGGIYVRPAAGAAAPPQRFKPFDTVSVHVLFKPGDDTTWGGGRAVERTINALRWLESIYGPYAYPMITNVHRIDGGGTEFPMMVMNGGASQGLILHEGGHIFTYGILGNNEWRSGWMDEGLTSYQTSWAQGLTQPERVRSGQVAPPPRLPPGYSANAVKLSPADQASLSEAGLVLRGIAQPIGTNAADFRDFGVYNAMIYSRAELMYSQLRDAIGDDAFRAFLHDYYARWALRHVDELAMRSSAERASGQDLRWFFDQWVHRVGLLDYALTDVQTEQRGGQWVTRARIERRGAYRHPMPVGVQVDTGWVIARGNPRDDVQTVEIVTATAPRDVRIDPYHFTWDYDRRNDQPSSLPLGLGTREDVFDYPLLDQSSRDHEVVAWGPTAWITQNVGTVVAARVRGNYAGQLDRFDVGVGYGFFASHSGSGLEPKPLTRVHLWASLENPVVPWRETPLMGTRVAAAFLDGILKLDWSRTWDASRYPLVGRTRMTKTLYATGAYVTDRFGPAFASWDATRVTEVGGRFRLRAPGGPAGSYWVAGGTVGGGLAGGALLGTSTARPYLRMELEAVNVHPIDSATTMVLRGYFGGTSSDDVPKQRAVFASTQDPFTTFMSPYLRDGAGTFDEDHIVARGGAGLRGVEVMPLRMGTALNAEIDRRLLRIGGFFSGLWLWGSVFTDAGLIDPLSILGDTKALADAGVGMLVRGRLYDRDIRLRLDAPIVISDAAPAISPLAGVNTGRIALRLQLSLSDVW